MLHGRVFAILRFRLRHISVDNLGILAMGHYRQIELLGCTEHTLQGLHLIYQHIAGAGTHEEFDARNMMHIELGEGIHIVVGSTIEEAIVYMALPGTQLSLLLPRLKGGGLRHRIRHLEVRSDATISSCTAFTLDIRLAG